MLFNKKYFITGKTSNGTEVQMSIRAKSRSRARDKFFTKHEYGSVRFVQKRKWEWLHLAAKWVLLIATTLALFCWLAFSLLLHLQTTQNF